jgi:hypothetical protein
VISHTKNKFFHTIVEVNNPILSDCGKIILHQSENRIGEIKNIMSIANLPTWPPWVDLKTCKGKCVGLVISCRNFV